MGIVLGGLSVRYSLKSLLTVGIALICVASFALNFTSLFAVFILMYAVFGLSKVTLRSMSNALVAQFYSITDRPKVVGYLIAGMASSYIFGSILAAFISDFRVVSLFVVFPISVAAFLLVLKGVPAVPSNVKRNPLHAFRQVLGNRSIVMSYVGNALAYIGPNTSMLTFFMPLFLQRFNADRAVAMMIFMVGFLLLIGGNVLGGRLVNRVGRKPLITLFQPLASVLSFAYIFAPSLILSALFWSTALLLFSLSMPAFNSLLLELAPEYRGTVTSLSETSQFIAQAIGSGVGGLILITYGFDGLGWFSLSGIAAGVLYHFFVIDPTKASHKQPGL
jgi:predicted MFS family arabinose efflux permease